MVKWRPGKRGGLASATEVDSSVLEGAGGGSEDGCWR